MAADPSNKKHRGGRSFDGKRGVKRWKQRFTLSGRIKAAKGQNPMSAVDSEVAPGPTTEGVRIGQADFRRKGSGTLPRKRPATHDRSGPLSQGKASVANPAKRAARQTARTDGTSKRESLKAGSLKPKIEDRLAHAEGKRSRRKATRLRLECVRLTRQSVHFERRSGRPGQNGFTPAVSRRGPAR